MHPKKEALLDKKEEQAEKKPYTKPNLTIHGDVEKITEYFSGQNTDGFGGSQIG